MERKGQNVGMAASQLNQINEQERGWDQVSEGGRSGTTFQQVRATIADKLQAAAQALHQKAARSDQSNEVSGFGHRAAGWLERSADYVSEVEPQQIRSDLENQVRRNPGRSLLIAGAVGLVLGGLLRRR